MLSFTEIIVLLASTLSSGHAIDYGQLRTASDTTVPPELKFMFGNKTRVELEYEECMSEYMSCLKYQRGEKVCAVSATTGQRLTFETLCEMTYENCKLKTYTWQFLTDDTCPHLIVRQG